uniref:Uncharacterized protein n=1 Tax=Chromera velia CCMP2878 TaxID=1169474 RepID=A0A0G4FVW7_9ALVE|eukprot:Cvel_498.t1-p1 / transcript=Cvel_498.t1 / gene=Cvel_498 / organism=Chromera_velia_CCMP2878 / gene_product=hypothetical protein / transcript_product=hypothetical protein / location=Cvel_scaffold15:199135-199698(-) / protein_length=188 / sequence_SO=supercontig / SO=protein_coding / is_pseudo=false
MTFQNELRGIICASGVLSLKRFWKLSSLSADLLRLRDSQAVVGLGGVLLTQDPFSEREEMGKFLLRSVDCDNEKEVRQLLSLDGVSGRFPCLLARAMQKGSEKCLRFLAEQTGRPGFALPQSAVTAQSVLGLSAHAMSALLDGGTPHPNMWIVSERRDSKHEWRPLLNVLIDAKKFDCAKILVERGAR